MRRLSLIIVSLLVLAVLAACSDDLPSDQTGCKDSPDDPTAAKYDLDNGCRYGDTLKHHGAEGEEHSEGEGDHSEGEEHSEGEGEHSEGETSTEEHSEGEATSEPNAEATPHSD